MSEPKLQLNLTWTDAECQLSEQCLICDYFVFCFLEYKHILDVEVKLLRIYVQSNQVINFTQQIYLFHLKAKSM